MAVSKKGGFTLDDKSIQPKYKAVAPKAAPKKTASPKTKKK